MTITDPTTHISDKPKKAPASHKNAQNAPSFTSRDYLNVEANYVPNLTDDAETKYLERIKLRSKLQALAPDSVPAPSTFEATLLTVNKQLNQLYKKGDDAGNPGPQREARANLEILYAKFGTTNLFNIANSIATSRLQKASIKEYEAMINNPEDAVNAILGKDDASEVQKIWVSKRELMKQGADYYVRPSILGMTKAQAKAYYEATV